MEFGSYTEILPRHQIEPLRNLAIARRRSRGESVGTPADFVLPSPDLLSELRRGGISDTRLHSRSGAMRFAAEGVRTPPSSICPAALSTC